jgi:sec-independent protein translocase protein TatA
MLSGLENPVHLLILLIVVLLIFGAKRLPEMGRSLGHGMREFRDGVTGRSAADVLESDAVGSTPASAQLESDSGGRDLARFESNFAAEPASASLKSPRAS